MFFKFNIHQIFLQKYPNVVFDYAFSNKKNSGQPLPVHQRQRHMFSWLTGRAACIPPALQGTHMYMRTVCMLSCRCLLDIHGDRQLLKEVKLKERTENISCVLFRLSSSRGQLVFERTNKGCFPRLSSAS